MRILSRRQRNALLQPELQTEWFARTTETGTTGCCPTQRVTLRSVIVTMVLLKEAWI